MANIYVLINREVEKGNALLDKKGNFTSFEKVDVMVKKSYIQDLKAGVIPFEKSFEDYRRDVIESGYIPVNAIMCSLGLFFDTEIAEPMPEPEPVEPEMVAN